MTPYGETGERMVDALLVGGPTDFPDSQRSVRIAADQARHTIKIEYYDGYQHFEPSEATSEGHGRQPRIYRWIQSTKIAE
jgi:hypothetical protein